MRSTDMASYKGLVKLGMGGGIPCRPHPRRFRSAIAKGRYRKGPRSQKSAGHMQNRKTKTNTITLVLTLTDTGAGRRGCPDPKLLGYRSLYITWQ